MLYEINAQKLNLNNLPYFLVETCPFRQLCHTIFSAKKEKYQISKIEQKKSQIN